MTSDSQAGKLTGRKVFLILAAAFGVILAANITLLVNAVGTFSGLVVPNSYVASQSFDAARDAQQALGWQTGVSYDEGRFRLDLTDKGGSAVLPQALRVIVGRPTTEQEDTQLELQPVPGGFAAPVELAPGNWRVEIDAIAPDGTPFTQRRAFFVSAKKT